MSSISELQPWLRPWATWIRHYGEYLVLRERKAGYTVGPLGVEPRSARAKGGHFRITSTYRSRRKQQELWDAWRSGRSKIPAAPPGQSAHEYRIAFDIARNRDPFYDDLLHELGDVWSSYGGLYGRFNFDPVHFQGGPTPSFRA